MVLGCSFVIPATAAFDQLSGLLDHCEGHHDWAPWEHQVMVHMLRQRWCVHHGCSYRCSGTKIRSLFNHELMHNGATSMSRIESFVTFVRQGRVNMMDLHQVKQAIFMRMVENLHLAGNTIKLIFRMGGFFEEIYHTRENLRNLLAPTSLRPAGWEVPYWEPIPPELFLTNIPPRNDAPANDIWRICWDRLRFIYAGGRL